jgi:ATP-binding cassette subfamily C (CFTR/MRP) protein 4
VPVCDAGVIVFSFARNLGWFTFAIRASSHLNARMLQSVLHARLTFFHQTPSGRILNVFSKDQGSVDEQLPAVRASLLLSSHEVATIRFFWR